MQWGIEYPACAGGRLRAVGGVANNRARSLAGHRKIKWRYEHATGDVEPDGLDDRRYKTLRVGRAGSRYRKVTKLAAWIHAKRVVIPLLRELVHESARENTRRFRSKEAEEFTRTCQLEVRVKAFPSRRLAPILSGGKHHEILSR